jgi:hypothetical protein
MDIRKTKHQTKQSQKKQCPLFFYQQNDIQDYKREGLNNKAHFF